MNHLYSTFHIRHSIFPLLLLFLFLFPKNVSSQTYSGTPFNGPHVIPGSIQIEDYDTGGQGVAYNDTDSANQGSQYRVSDGVDIETTSDGSGSSFHVGWTKPGEWLKYSVNVTTSGTYNLILRSQQWGSASGGKVRLEVDGTNITGSVTLIMGTWNGWNTHTIPNISLTAGQHVVRLFMESTTNEYVGSFNWMYFELTSPVIQPEPVIKPLPGSSKFYVSVSGNDSNPGTLAQPWKTITKAANTLTSGQTVYFRAGTYNERLIPKNSGTKDNYIIFTNYPGEIATIDGTSLSIPRLEGLVNIKNKSHIRIAGLKVTNAGAGVADGFWNMGITVENSDHIVIDNNLISHIYSLGVDVNHFSNYVLIDNNEITDTNFGEKDTEVALGIAWFSHHVDVTKNNVHHTKNEGIDPVAGAHDIRIFANSVHDLNAADCSIGIYIDAWTEHEYNIDIFNNISHHNCGEGITVASEGGGLLENVRIFNNIVYNNTGTLGGIGVANWTTLNVSVNTLNNIKIVNNTIYANQGGGVGINNSHAGNVLIRNNILYQNSGGTVKIYPGVDSANISQDHNLTTNPNFVNENGANFHLQSASAAINAGSSVDAPNFDFDNYTRPAGSIYDIGAFEYGASNPYISPSPTPTGSPKPGDANGDGKVDFIDYAIWRLHFGQTTTNGATDGDFNNSNFVDFVDYAIWRLNFGK